MKYLITRRFASGDKFWATRWAYYNRELDNWRTVGGWRYEISDATRYDSRDEAIAVNAILALGGDVISVS